MKILKKKIPVIAIAIFLMLSMSTSMIPLPSASAHYPPYIEPHWVYVSASPLTVGVNQQVLIVMWDSVARAITNQPEYFDLNITKPDGTAEHLGPFAGDLASSTYTLYTPTQVGTYKVVATSEAYVYSVTPPPSLFGPSTYTTNDTMLALSSDPANFTVQQEAIPGYPEAPLPTSYWTTPINGINRNWYVLAGVWLSGAAQNVGPTSRFAYGTGPETAHVLWTRQYWDGGIMDARVGNFQAYTGQAYEDFGLFPPIIMNGKLYYNVYTPPRFGWYEVDLYTGQTLVFHNTTGTFNDNGLLGNNPQQVYQGALTFGQILDFEHPNSHGEYPYLWSNNAIPAMHGGTGSDTDTWSMFDAFTGQYILNLTGIPTTGTTVYQTPQGNILKYALTNYGTTANPSYRLTIWNSTAALDQPYSGFWRPANYTYGPGGTPANPATGFPGVNVQLGYTLNVTTPLTGGTTIRAIREGKFIIGGTTGTYDGNGGVSVPGVMWCLSLARGQEGTLLWNRTFTPPPQTGNITVSMGTVDPEDGVFVFSCAQTLQRWGYSIDTGQKLWGPTAPENSWNYYGMSSNIYQGLLLGYGIGGVLVAYNITTGVVVWNYKAESIGFESYYGYVPISGTTCCDGKIYIYSTEHSPSVPLRRDSLMRCINATNGKEMWNITDWFSGVPAIADGYLVSMNLYDDQIYCYGKGPSATTVTASPKTSVQGDSVLIEGTIMDMSAGVTMAKGLDIPGNTGAAVSTLDDPSILVKGVAAVSDADQKGWMEHIYMQQPAPTNAKGVDISLDTIDPNNNYIHIGNTTNDLTGMYSFAFTPQVPGKYTIIASFAGSKSYGASYAETSIFVGNPAATPAPSVTAQANLATTSDLMYYIVGAAVAIILAIAIVGVLMLRKRP